jgi:SAM-dependent methyltransferase
MFSARATEPDHIPVYDRNHPDEARKEWAKAAAKQLELTAAPFLELPFSECRVIDIGCGRGDAALELARRCRSVVGLEPNPVYAQAAAKAVRESKLSNIEILQHSVDDVDASRVFDLVVMDNVLEHIEDQRRALHRMSTLLTVGGVFVVIVPNRLWPFEVHYGLPFLSYLPLPAANLYLRISGRGQDYRDSSYAPTYRGLQRLLRERTELASQLTLPAQPSLARGGLSLVYRAGIGLIRRWPAFWAISKAFVVVGKKTSATPPLEAIR